MKESEFSAWLRERLKPGHLCRIENTVGSGMPDINWCVNGHEIWIETKVKKTGKTLLEPEQRVWGIRHTIAGGIVCVLAADDKVVELWDFRKLQLNDFVRYGKYMQIITSGVTIGKQVFNSSLLVNALGIQSLT